MRREQKKQNVTVNDFHPTERRVVNGLRLLPLNFVPPKLKLIRCQYLGAPVYRGGARVTVKCNCGNGATTEQYHAAHTCHAPQNVRRSGEPGQCVPTMPTEFDDDHATEAALFHVCRVCPIRDQPTKGN